MTDFLQRVNFCKWILNNTGVVSHILFTDEARFHKTAATNKQNDRVWSIENPHPTHTSHCQLQFSVCVWMGIIDQYLVGPFFFNENLNSSTYEYFLKHQLPKLLEEIPLRTRKEMYFMQDGAPAHSTKEIIEYLEKTFKGRIISRNTRTGIAWPPRSPDLTPPDFFLWGMMRVNDDNNNCNTRNNDYDNNNQNYNKLTGSCL